MYNYSKLLGLMREKGITQEELAKQIGISSTTLNKRLKNNSQFQQDEMKKILSTLGLTIEDVVPIFYTQQLAFSQVEKEQVNEKVKI